jgi:hypothetical protein
MTIRQLESSSLREGPHCEASGGGKLGEAEITPGTLDFRYHGPVIQTIVFFLVLGFPFIIYLVNSALAQRESRGIAAGIPKPKEAKPPRGRSGRARTAKVRSARVTSCGRNFSHMMLALMGSSDSCRHCTYITEVPPQPGGDEDEHDAAVRAAEEIIDQAKH